MYNKHLFTLFPFCLMCLTLFAQLGSGLIVNQDAYDSIPLLPSYGRKASIDTISKIDLSPYCPEVQNQSFTNTCTGWALGYGAYSIEKAVANGWYGEKEKITQNSYSAKFIYNQIKKGGYCEKGSEIEAGLRLLREKGNLLSKNFDQHNNCDRLPTNTELERARQNTIVNFNRLFDNNAGLAKKIAKVKESLKDQKPVIISLQINRDFQSKLIGAEWWFPKSSSSSFNDFHALVVVGFDDLKGAQGAFKIMNSYGKRWGDDGFFWMRYIDFAEYCFHAYQITIDESQQIVKPKIKGKAVLQVFNKANSSFETPLPQKKSNIYSFDTRRWKVNDYYQIMVSDVVGELFLYAFSYDSKGKINLHWPRDEELNEKFEGRHESAVISSPSATLVIPSDTTALLLEEPGTEYIILLLSQRPIDDLNTKIAGLKSKGRNNFLQVITETFGPEKVLIAQTFFSDIELSFEAPAESEGIVPLVIQLEVTK